MGNRAIGRSACLSDIKRALKGKGFVTGVLGIVLVIVFSSAEEIIVATRINHIFPNGQHAKFIIDALASNVMTLTLPILCALPYTTAFVDDINSGFIKHCLPRSGVAAYIKGKLIACCLSGGLVPFVGILLAYALFAIMLAPLESGLAAGEMAQPIFAEALAKAATLFFSGAFWSLVGFTFSAITMNRYMAFASPFIFYYILIILNERYFSGLYMLYPKEWQDPSDVWVMGDYWVMGRFGVILLLCVLMGLLCVGFASVAKRRLSDV